MAPIWLCVGHEAHPSAGKVPTSLSTYSFSVLTSSPSPSNANSSNVKELWLSLKHVVSVLCALSWDALLQTSQASFLTSQASFLPSSYWVLLRPLFKTVSPYSPHHILTSSSLLIFFVCHPLCSKVHKSRGFLLLCSLLYSQCLEEC